MDGGGEMGAMPRGFDWAAHPLGEPADRPAALKLATSLCLHSSVPPAIYWGAELLRWDAVGRVAATARLRALNADLAGEVVARCRRAPAEGDGERPCWSWTTSRRCAKRLYDLTGGMGSPTSGAREERAGSEPALFALANTNGI